MKQLVRRISAGIIAIGVAFALGVGLASPALAKPPKPKGSTPVGTVPLAQFGSAIGNDVAALATFTMEGKRYVVVGGDITGYKDAANVTRKGDKLFVMDENGVFVWGAPSIQGGWLQQIQSVTSAGGDLVTLYIGGTFTSVEGKARGHAAAYQVRSTGGKLQIGLSPTWKPNVSGNIRGITYGDGRIYLAASAVTAVDPINGAKLWKTEFQCGAIALIYANKSVYAGGFSRKAGGVTSKGSFKLDPKTGKVDKKFKPSIPANKVTCGSGKDGYSGSIPLDFAWDSANKRLIECDGGIKNYVRSLNPRTGKRYWAHRMDGDAQVCTIVAGKYLFVGFHRGGPNTDRYRYNYGDAGMMLGAKSGVQKKWQPKPDFAHSGANRDHRNNGIIDAVVVGKMLIVGGGFHLGSKPNLIAFRIK